MFYRETRTKGEAGGRAFGGYGHVLMTTVVVGYYEVEIIGGDYLNGPYSVPEEHVNTLTGGGLLLEVVSNGRGCGVAEIPVLEIVVGERETNWDFGEAVRDSKHEVYGERLVTLTAVNAVVAFELKTRITADKSSSDSFLDVMIGETNVECHTNGLVFLIDRVNYLGGYTA